MSGWARKKFWKDVTTESVDGGFCVRLDGRDVRTPGKALLRLPSRAMASAVAAEWDAQDDQVDPTTMPVTRSANSAIDKVAPQFKDVADMIAGYGGSDLICYRADGPQALIDRQAAVWDPLLEYSAAKGAPLKATTGIVHCAQPAESLRILSGIVHGFDPFELTALHDLVAISGSLIMGLAAIEGHTSAEALWDASRVDETWQEEQWGEDEEAQELAESKRRDFLHALRFFRLIHNEN